MRQRKVYAYTRVSTGRQADEGQSLDVQAESIRAYCSSKKYAEPKLFSDSGISGRSTKNRPGLEAAVLAACETKGLLVVSSLSRLGRSLADLCRTIDRLKDSGADLVILDLGVDTSTAVGRMVFSIIGSICEFESNMIGERVKAVQQHQRAERGFRPNGPPPAGYRREGGTLVQVPDEYAWSLEVDAIISEHTNYAEAARVLNEAGYPTLKALRHGGEHCLPWDRHAVRRMATRPPAFDPQ